MCAPLLQIVTQVETIYDFRLPTEVHKLLSYFRLSITLGIEGIPFECLSPDRYKSKLLFWIIAPATICALVALTAAIRLVRKHGSTLQAVEERARALIVKQVLMSALPAVLYVAFAIYPIVSSAAFEAFSCHEFDGETGWLIADVAVQCGSLEHDAVRQIAIIAIIVYPVGLWLLNASLLVFAHEAIKRDSEDSSAPHLDSTLAGAISFLYREYEPAFWWWELVEMARRFLLVGLFVTTPAKRGSVMQIAVAAMVSLVYAVVQAYAQPYRQTTTCWR